MNATEQMMYDRCTPMANRISICVCKGEVSFHALSLHGFSRFRKMIFTAYRLRFCKNDCFARCLRVAMECVAMAGIVCFSALLTLLWGV
jgi:hypothetical protein